MDELEQVLNDELAVLAARAPEPGDLARTVRRRVRRRRVGIALGSVGVVAIVAVAIVAVVAGLMGGPSLRPVAGGHGEVAAGGAM